MSGPRLRIEAANAAVGVEDGQIVPDTGRFDVRIVVPDGELRPGLINAHDHLHRNHYGRLGMPPYPSAYAWGRDIQRRFADDIARGRSLPRRSALLRGAWKNLLCGVTTVVHHDPWEPDFERGFPLRVARVPTPHSLGFGQADVDALARDGTPYCIHLAEGVDPESAEEVRELDRRGLLTSALRAVHVVGADDDGIARIRGAHAAVVWCPTSNHFLLGRTAPAELLAPGIDVLLGSDSLLTADGNLLDEIRAARALALVEDDRLRGAVGDTAARSLGLAAPSLAAGAAADLVVLRRDLLDASAGDVALVVAGGVLRVLDPALLPAIGGGATTGALHTERGVTRWIDPSGLQLPMSPASTKLT